MRVARDVGLAVAVVGYLLFAWVTVDRRADEARIRSVVAETVQAINKRDLGGTLRHVSRNYRGSDGLNRERLRMLVAQGLRVETDFQASARIESIGVYGEDAAVIVHAHVAGDQGQALYSRVLTLELRLEPARHAVVIPTRVWRVVSAGNLGLSYAF